MFPRGAQRFLPRVRAFSVSCIHRFSPFPLLQPLVGRHERELSSGGAGSERGSAHRGPRRGPGRPRLCRLCRHPGAHVSGQGQGQLSAHHRLGGPAGLAGRRSARRVVGPRNDTACRRAPVSAGRQTGQLRAQPAGVALHRHGLSGAGHWLDGRLPLHQSALQNHHEHVFPRLAIHLAPTAGCDYNRALGCGVYVLRGTLLLCGTVASNSHICWQNGPYVATCSKLYDAHILFQASLQAVIALLFLIYGIILLVTLNRAASAAVRQTQSLRHRKTSIQIAAVMLVTLIAFSLRVFALAYRPATGKFLPAGLFYTFNYIIPDTLPPLLQAYVLFTVEYSRRRPVPKNAGDYVQLEEQQA